MSLPESLLKKMQPRIALTLFTGNTVGRILMASPVRHVLFLVRELRRHRIVARGVNARIDGIEDAADENGPPDDLLAELFRQRLDIVKGEIGPGAGAVEEEFDHWRFLLL